MKQEQVFAQAEEDAKKKAKVAAMKKPKADPKAVQVHNERMASRFNEIQKFDRDYLDVPGVSPIRCRHEIDLYGVKMDEKITVKVSIHLTGDAIGVKEEGGVLNSPTSEIEVSCFPMDIIGSIDVDISALSIGDSMQVSHIKLDDKHELMSSPDSVVASVTHAMREEEPVVEEEDKDLFMDEEGGEAPAGGDASGDSGESTDSE